MSTYRVPKCGRYFVKFDDVTIYPVLVVARTGRSFFPYIAKHYTAETYFSSSWINTAYFVSILKQFEVVNYII